MLLNFYCFFSFLFDIKLVFDFLNDYTLFYFLLFYLLSFYFLFLVNYSSGINMTRSDSSITIALLLSYYNETSNSYTKKGPSLRIVSMLIIILIIINEY